MHYVGILFGGDETLLEPYYEGLEVDTYIASSKEEKIKEYIKDREYAIDWRKKKIADNDPQSSKYQEWINKHPKLTKRTAWSQIKKDYEGSIDENGNILSTYNPNSEWDWYTIGGRWSGYFPLKERNYNNEIVWVDQALVSEIDWDEYRKTNNSPYCFISEDGEWHAKGNIGWFASTNDKDTSDWEKEVFDAIEFLDPNTAIVAIDFHI